MDLKTFLENFDAIAEAPGGIPKLRSLILDLAVQGKLVPQNPEDEPASVLLDKLRFEKDRLIQEGKIKGSKTLPPINVANMPFAPPDGWEWVHLESLVELITKGSSPKWQGVNYVNPGSGILFITSENVRNYVLDVSNPKYVEAKFNEIEPRSILQKNDLLMNIVGASIGRTAIYELDEIANINQAVCLIRLINSLPLLNHAYMLLFFNSTICINFMLDKQVDNARANLSMGNIAKFPIPLPPLAEQKRIVEKVDELMGLCDRLSSAKQMRDNLRQKLRESAIASLMNAETDEKLDAVWVIVRDNWHNLSQHPQDVSDLRQAVLQLAVRGKLVPQNFEDEPASVLLEKVEAEKRHLIKEKKLKERWNPVAVSPDAIPYKIPMNWKWIRILDGVERVTVGHVGSMQNEYLPEGLPFLRSQNVRENRFDPLGLKFISQEFHDKLAKSKLSPRDVVVVRSGNVGTTCVIPEELEDANCSDLVIVKRPMAIDSGFLSYYMNSAAKSHVKEGTVGIALTHFNTESVASLPIPLPPLAEQKRIVAKVDELMKLCDQLEASLRQSQQWAESLAASAISHLTI